MTDRTDKDRVIIFDTTMCDGEQSPGASMTLVEKQRIAAVLEELGVDVIEAGFPIASNGDFEAVLTIAAQVKECQVAGLARAARKDTTAPGKPCRAPSGRASTPSSRPARCT